MSDEFVDIFHDTAPAAKPPVYLGSWVQDGSCHMRIDVFNYTGKIPSRCAVCPGWQACPHLLPVVFHHTLKISLTDVFVGGLCFPSAPGWNLTLKVVSMSIMSLMLAAPILSWKDPWMLTIWICWLPYPQNYITGNTPYSTNNATHNGNVRCPYWYCTLLYFTSFLANALRYVPIQSLPKFSYYPQHCDIRRQYRYSNPYNYSTDTVIAT